MIILFGNVGSGKGTQAEILAKKTSYQALSSGEVLRQYKDRADIQSYMQKGQLVPDELLLEMLGEQIKQAGGKVILDGFPRTVNQAKWLVETAQQQGLKISDIMHLQIPKAEAMKRLLARKRHDDSEAAIEQRFSEYEQKVLPTIDYLKQAGFSVKEINADQPVEEVSQEIAGALHAR